MKKVGLTTVTFYAIVSLYPTISHNIKDTLLNPFKKNKVDVLGDLKKCRVTHSGVEYEGNIAQSKTGILCQNWDTPNPIHKMAEQIVDKDFPEASKKKAKNYCRNPQHWQGRPWCYTLDFNIETEECNVPLCLKKECRLTGLGIEYGGLTQSSGSMTCLHWTDIKGTQYKDIAFDSLFPDGTRKAAENRCRNPNSDVGGPWCFVEADPLKNKMNINYEKMYCGIPLCHPKPCMVAVADVSSDYRDYHTVFTRLPPNTTSIDFSVKLWRPEQWHSGELRLALTVYPLPAKGSHMRARNDGIEVVISTYKSGLTPKAEEEADWNVEPGILSGTRWQDLELEWTGGFISLKVKGKTMSVFTKDYIGDEKNFKGEFNYFSIKGSYALWNFPFCTMKRVYEEHVTTHGDFERRWPFPKSHMSRLELKFFIRGFHSAIVEMKAAAMLQYPSIQLTLQNTKNITSLTLKESPEQERVTLEEVNVESLLSFWEWEEFIINIDASRIEVHWIKDKKPAKLLSVIHPKIEFIKWFSIGSRHSTIHWALHSISRHVKLKIPAEFPECVMKKGGSEFSGSQSVSASGLPCLPWNDPFGTIPSELKDSDFVDGSKEKAKNYCRNPTHAVEGPYCYVADLTDTGHSVRKQFCFPRQCRSKQCSISGTGNDFVGPLSVTLSGRSCQQWTSSKPHSIPEELLNKEMFPELSLSDASNFCRNPSHDAAGPWCYTSDPLVDTDVCDVPDCDDPGHCRVIVKGTITPDIYYLPQWRSTGLIIKVKSWDPKNSGGIRFIAKQYPGNVSYYKLDLGAGNNDQVILYFKGNEEKERILKQKTIARVIPSGSWIGFDLFFLRGEIQIKYEDVPTSFFHWKYKYSDGVESIFPKFLSYSTVGNGSSVGLIFPCEECHTHISNPGLNENVYPLNWWQPHKQLTNNTFLNLNVRGVGTFIIVLMRLVKQIASHMLIEVSDHGKIVVKSIDSVLAYDIQGESYIFNNHSWNNFSLYISEKKLILTKGEKSMVNYVSKRPLLFYFFSVSVSDGFLIWNANCLPPNIDSPPVNGGWSKWGPWQCSVTCGGGRGVRKRICNFPPPNLFGEPCNGSDTMEGKCNKFKCGDVPLVLYDVIKERTIKQAHNIRKWVGESLVVDCDLHVLTELKYKSPKIKIEWTKNGLPLSSRERAAHITPDQYTVEINSVDLSDSGIYICSLENFKGEKAVIKLTSVTVVTNTSTRCAREGNTIVLDCAANPIFFLFSELTQFWTLNGLLYKDYGATSLSLMDVDLLQPVRKEHQGDWECIVVQVKHNLTWVTAWFKLEVKKNTIFAITFDNLFIGQHFKIFGKNIALNAVFFLVALFLVVFIVTVLYHILCPKRKRNQKAFYRNKKLAEKKRNEILHRNKDNEIMPDEMIPLNAE